MYCACVPSQSTDASPFRAADEGSEPFPSMRKRKLDMDQEVQALEEREALSQALQQRTD